VLALAYDRYGSADVLAVRDVPSPQPSRGEVLVRIRAAALNPKDVMVRKGRFRLLSGARFPKLVGLDFAGEIARASRGTNGPAEGARVFGFLGGWSALRGTVAEYVAVSPREVAAMPRTCSFEEAAALPLAASTALQALRDVSRVRQGVHICVHGASGGVGTFAIQIAKLLGARVTTTSSAASRQLCRALGADQTLDYAAADPFCGDHTFDVVFDAYGNRSLALVRRALTDQGVYVTTVPSRRILLDTVRTLRGGSRARLVVVRPQAVDLEHLARLVDEGLVQPAIDRVVPLAGAVDVMRHLETRHAHGKVVIRIE
jgi:NADPH:quinone reductase-like Zn-dependent oxidoreductase